MKRQRLTTALKIAFSAVCVIACVLLAIMWARSYQRNDIAVGPASKSSSVLLSSYGGRMSIIVQPATITRWHYLSRAKKVAAISSASVGGGVVLASRLFAIRCDSKNYKFASLPYTYPVLLACTFAASPWIRQLNWRFSLRTMLVATTFVAAVLGLITYMAR